MVSRLSSVLARHLGLLPPLPAADGQRPAHCEEQLQCWTGQRVSQHSLPDPG